MPLTGVDPFNPIPSDRREFIFAAGASSTTGKSRDVLIYANKTSAGSESTNVIGDPIASADDVVNRFGRRSEANQLYKKYVPVDPNATIYIVAVPEAGGGSASSVQFTFATTALTDSLVEITLMGEKVFATFHTNDTAIQIASSVVAAVNAAADGSWPVTADNSGGASAVVTVTFAQTGERGDLYLGSGTNRGMRMRILLPTSAVGTTVAKGSLTVGVGIDDFTSAYAEASASEYFYQISPKHATATVTNVDNGIGEHIENLRIASLPSVGKTQVAFFGLVGTQAQATAVANSAAANSVYARFFHQKNSDWAPGLIAAHHAAVIRSQEILHPSANSNGYASSDNTIYQMPPCFLKADVMSETEIIADLKNGISAIWQTPKGKPYLVRHITSRSLNAQGNYDWRAREGHLTSAIEFAWQCVIARWVTQRQPNVDDDPPANSKPKQKTSYPSSLRTIIDSVIDDLTGDKPLGIYDGPVLSPSKAAQMKKTKVVTKAGPGKLSASVEFFAVEHLIGTEWTFREASPAY